MGSIGRTAAERFPSTRPSSLHSLTSQGAEIGRLTADFGMPYPPLLLISSDGWGIFRLARRLQLHKGV